MHVNYTQPDEKGAKLFNLKPYTDRRKITFSQGERENIKLRFSPS